MDKRNPFRGNRTHPLKISVVWVMVLSLLAGLALPPGR